MCRWYVLLMTLYHVLTGSVSLGGCPSGEGIQQVLTTEKWFSISFLKLVNCGTEPKHCYIEQRKVTPAGHYDELQVYSRRELLLHERCTCEKGRNGCLSLSAVPLSEYCSDESGGRGSLTEQWNT